MTDDPVWAEWSIAQLDAASLRGPLFINNVIYAELAVRYERIEDLNSFLDEAGLVVAPSHERPFSWPEKSLPSTGASAGQKTVCSRISSSEHMPLWAKFQFSREM